jgi:exodeoxyribonuclease VII large subunit
MVRHIERAGERITSLRSLLVSLGPDSVLKRGFTLTLGPDGKPVRRLADVRPGDTLRTRLAEGEITSTVNS